MEQLTSFQQAQSLHEDIMIQERIASQSLTQIALDLKTMRDNHLYRQLGYTDFEEYCDKATKTGKRQAYNLISLVEEYKIDRLNDLSYLGSTKLLELKKLAPEERDELINSGEAEEMSVRELKEKIKILTDKNEQLSFELSTVQDKISDTDRIAQLEAELQSKQAEIERIGKYKDGEIKSLQARLDDTGNAMRKTAQENSQLKQQINDLENRPIEVAVADPSEEQIAKIRAEAEAAAKAEYESKLSAEKEKVQSIAHTSPKGDETAVIKHYFSEIQRQMNEAVELIGKNENKEKLKSAFSRLLDECRKIVSEI